MINEVFENKILSNYCEIKSDCKKTIKILNYINPIKELNSIKDLKCKLNIIFLLDNSLSMSVDKKFDLAIKTIKQIIKNLNIGDKISLITFDSVVKIIFENEYLNEQNKDVYIEKLIDLVPERDTDRILFFL